jgi:hypothetical protein
MENIKDLGKGVVKVSFSMSVSSCHLAKTMPEGPLITVITDFPSHR